MPWTRTSTVTTSLELGHNVRMSSGVFVFRGTQSVFGWRKDAPELAWVHSMPEENVFGPKHLFAVPGALVTLRNLSSDQPISLVWLDPSTGAVKRERAYDFERSQDGFTASGEFLFLHGQLPGRRPALLRISAETGTIVEQAEAPLGDQIRASSRRLYLTRGVNGLSHTPVDGVQWTHSPVGWISELTLWQDQLFFFVTPEEEGSPWDLVWWNADEARALGRMRAGPALPLILAPGPRAGVVAGHLRDKGLWVLDITAGTCLWSRPLVEGEKVTAACWTPHGLVMAIKPAGVTPVRLELREPATGELLQVLPSTLFEAFSLFWMEDRLMACDIDGLESFAWE